MFKFLDMISNYEERKVGRYEVDGLFISTAYVNYGSKPYETAVEDNRYNFEGMVIVEHYDNIEEARVGHDKWVALMTSDNPPSELVDVSNSEIQRLADILTNEKRVASLKNDGK